MRLHLAFRTGRVGGHIQRFKIGDRFYRHDLIFADLVDRDVARDCDENGLIGSGRLVFAAS